METKMKTESKFSQSIMFKAIIVVALTMILLIPSVMIQNLIRERQSLSYKTIQKINSKWALSQTLCAPLMAVPYSTTKLDKDKKSYTEEHKFYLTPENLEINAQLQSEKRHYGIYEAILYKSDINFSGSFSGLNNLKIDNSAFHFDKAYIIIGVTDLRGISQNVDFKVNNKSLVSEIGDETLSFNSNSDNSNYYDENVEDVVIGYDNNFSGKTLKIPLKDLKIDNNTFQFSCNLKLNGSSSIKFIPVGQTTSVKVNGDWVAPSFIGAFSPEYSIENKQFNATWNVLSFNRNIPEYWTDNDVSSFSENAFGVDLIEPVDHYQQNMRSAKYAIMFIALTFVVFFFVEVLTKKRIHPIQYLLVGVALILFYSLLLSFSEQIGFAFAYLIASIATISLITIYVRSIFKNKTQTAMLAALLCVLYIFLYVILQLEDIALLIGSIGLFVILAMIMFLSRKIQWYKTEETIETEYESNEKSLVEREI